MGKPTRSGKVAQATINFTQNVAMGRKYGKNATTKNNVLTLVEALLALADGKIGVAGDKLKVTFKDNGEIAVSGDKLKATLKLLWEKGNELLVSGKFQQKRNNNTTKIVEGITKEDLWTLVECLGKALELSPPKDEKNVDNTKRRGDAIQDVLECLKDLGILELKPSAKTEGFWIFSLKLEHQTKPKENLEVIDKKIEEKWKIKFGSVTVEISHETPKPKEETINWQEICRQNLALQKELTTNLFTNACGMTPQLDGVYVPLAIVERQKPKPQQEEKEKEKEKEKETEKLIPIAEERFFEDVLRQGKSDISQGRKIAIIGEPGAGKTTRLQKIADWILEQELGLPVWIDLAELGAQSICEHLEKVWLYGCPGGVTRGDLEAQMSRVWLLLDGVDEMADTQGMQQLGKDLLRTWVQAARVVVTCRVNVWEADKNAFSGFDVFRNLEFNAEQVTEYIRRWFAAMGDAATGESLEAQLAESENSRLKELIQNPLRLWMLCQIWSSRQGTLPDTQAKLYASFIEYFYSWKEQFIKSYAKLCGKTEGECQKLLHEGLGELAKAAIDGKSSRFRLSYRLVSQYLGTRSDETSLLSLALSLGWLNRVGIDFDELGESVYGFYHATFQEYFAALAVEDWDYFLPRNHVDFPVVGKEYRIFEAQWKQVILLWLGRGDVADEEKEGFIEKLVNFEDGCGKWNFEKADKGFYNYRAYFLAAVEISEFKSCTLADVILQQVVKWGFGYFNEEKQEWLTFFDLIEKSARETLPKTDRKRAIEELCRLLEHSQYPKNSRFWVTNSLGEIEPGNSQAIDAFVRVFKTTEDEDTHRWAADSLGKIGQGNPQAIAALLRIIESTNHENIHSQAARSLGKIGQGNPQAIAALLRIIESTKDEYLRSDAADSLGEIGQGNPQAIAALLRIIESTKYECIRWQAARSLGKIGQGNPQAIADLVIILETTKDESPRRQAAESLGEIGQGNPKAITALIRIIEITDDRYTRRGAAESLGEIGQGNPQAVAALIKVLETAEYGFIHWLVARGLGKIGQGNSQAIAALTRVIESPEDEDTREWAAWSLGRIGQGSPQAIAALVRVIEIAEDGDPFREAAESLEKIGQGNPQAITALVGVIETTAYEFIHWLVARSLGEIGQGNPQATAALFKVIQSTEDELNLIYAAESLGKIDLGNPQATAALVKVIEYSKDEYNLMKAAHSLGEIGQRNSQAIAALVKVIESTEDRDIFREGANSLGKIAPGNSQAIAALVKVIESTENKVIGMNAAWSLGKIITTKEQRKGVVFALQPHLKAETYKNNFDLYNNCYQLLCNIAKDLPYPDFYRAWHGLTETQSSPLVQTLNLAQFPQFLQAQLTEINLHQTLQLICIDTSKFIDSDNPALDIYGQFLDKNFPQHPNRELETLAQLKFYWNQLCRDSEKHLILIFYEGPTSPATEGLSPTFLNALTRFGGTICLIADTPHPLLQTFSPHDSDLVQSVVNWLERVHLES